MIRWIMEGLTKFNTKPDKVLNTNENTNTNTNILSKVDVQDGMIRWMVEGLTKFNTNTDKTLKTNENTNTNIYTIKGRCARWWGGIIRWMVEGLTNQIISCMRLSLLCNIFFVPCFLSEIPYFEALPSMISCTFSLIVIDCCWG